VSQGLQVLHSADAVPSQGEEPAERREGSGVRRGGTQRPPGSEPAAPGCQGLHLAPPQGEEGAPLSSDHGKRSPWGQELPVPQVGKAAQVLDLLNLVLENKKRGKRQRVFLPQGKSDSGSTLGLLQPRRGNTRSHYCRGSFMERARSCDSTESLAESMRALRLHVWVGKTWTG